MEIFKRLRNSDIKKFLIHSVCSYNTVALSWSRIEDDLHESYEFKISFGKLNEVVVEFQDQYGPDDEDSWTKDHQIDVESGDIKSLNDLYDWLVARPDRFYAVGFHFEEWGEDGWNWFQED